VQYADYAAPWVASCLRKRRDAGLEWGPSDLLEMSLEEVSMLQLQAVQPKCPVCARPVKDHHTTVTVHGVTFHAYCAGYKRRAAA
jgi:hypothetical protein